MSKNLVIVESPAKARTIERYLGDDYRVLASYGHVRDLPENPGKGKFGVDVEHDFAPEYVINEDRRKQINEIAKAAKGSDMVYLATDLDREGEAIAWHVSEAASVPLEKTRRVTFSEITEPAIREAFANPRDIDQNLVDAQQTRRIVDRLVGYTLSPLLSRKVRGGLSAGRVQSVAVRLVVEREREIDAFTAREYWTIEVLLATAAGDTFAAELVRIDGEQLDLPDEATTERHAAALRETHPVVRKIGVRTQKRSPAPPFTTSTLQQEASRKLSFSPKRTMSIAQRLYEGVDTPDGHVGLITYMRTDSTAMAGVAMGEAREVIGDRYGEPFTMPKGRVYKTTSKGAQEAHESIRPTSFRRDPDSLAGTLQSEELRLYRLIWQRALASQMAPKELETTTVDLADGPYELRASSTADAVRGLRAGLHRGSRRRRRRGRGGRAAAAGARRGRAHRRAGGHADPALHRAAAAIHRGDAHQGARGARHRPAIDLRGHDLDDHRPRLRPGRGAAPVPGAGRRDRDGPAGRAFRRLRRPRVHRPDGGGARRDRPRRAGVGAAAAGVLPAPPRPRRGGPEEHAPPGLHDRGDRRGLLARPSHGHPPRSERPVPRLLDVPRAQGDAATAR